MAKKKVVRRWSKEDHRTLKTMAKDKKRRQEDRQGIKTNRLCNACDGREAWCVVEYAVMNSDQSLTDMDRF
jgi:hypothetical protein